MSGVEYYLYRTKHIIILTDNSYNFEYMLDYIKQFIDGCLFALS